MGFLEIWKILNISKIREIAGRPVICSETLQNRKKYWMSGIIFQLPSVFGLTKWEKTGKLYFEGMSGKYVLDAHEDSCVW